MSNSPCIFVIEPDSKVVHPYDLLRQLYPSSVELIRYQTVNQAEKDLHSLKPVLVLLSCSFSPARTVDFLEQLKNIFVDQVIPVIFVVDWSKSLSKIIGTHWGNKVGIFHTLSSEEEIEATLLRLHPSLPIFLSPAGQQ